MPQIDSKPAAGANEEEQPKLFKLNIDCLQEIFDYLSLEDICSVALTCKRLHVITRDYFEWNDLGKSVNKMHFHSSTLNEVYIQSIAQKLNSVETVSFFIPGLNCEFDEHFFKHCTNCKHLCIRSWDDFVIGTSNEWLRRSYPTLEYLELKLDGIAIDELGEFSTLNPNLKLAIDENTLLWSRDSLFKANVKLPVLSVMIREYSRKNTIFELLDSLHAQGVYHKLHLYVRLANQQTIDRIAATKGLEKLYLRDCDNNLVLSSLTSVNELALITCRDDFDVQATAINLTNLKRLYFTFAKPETIRTFIRHSPNLKSIKVEKLFYGSLELEKLNKLRAKLADANKVSIYLREGAFLAERWSSIVDDSDMVSVRRAESDEWFIPFQYVPVPYESQLDNFYCLHEREQMTRALNMVFQP